MNKRINSSEKKRFKRKIIIHNLTLKGIEIVPGILDFDQRGIVYAGKYDVVITKTPIEKQYLNYIKNVGWDLSYCTFLNPATTTKYKYNSVFYDKDLNEKLVKLEDYYLDTYHATKEEELFAKRIKKNINQHIGLSKLYGTKSGFKNVAKKLKLPVAKGFGSIHSVYKLRQKIEELFKRHILEVVVKMDEGISGAGITKIKASDYQRLSEAAKKKLLKASFLALKQIQKTSGAVVEEWLDNIVASPSVQIQVDDTGGWRIVSMHDQILEGSEKWYVGCRFPQTTLRGELLKRIIKDEEKFTSYLISKGFFGFFGLDMVITKTADLFWVEANMRKPGTFYPRIIAEKLNNDSLQRVSYIARDFTIKKLTGIKFSELHDKLKEFLYIRNKKQTGIFLYNTGALREVGRFDVICLGRNNAEAQEMYDRIIKKLSII